MTETPRPRQRRWVITIMLLVVILAGAAAIVWYLRVGQWYESTDNAYLTGNLVEVGAQIDGMVIWIAPEQNQPVRRGQELLRLDDGDELALVDLRKNELALAVQDVLTLRAEVERLQAEQRLKAVTLELATEEHTRRQRLFPRNMVSKEELDAARTRAEEVRVALDTARLALAKAQVRAGNQELIEHPQVMAAAARLRSAYRNWKKTRIVAPVDGEIARRRVQAGQQVESGTPLFSIAERGGAWIEANFKETQLRYIRPGQAVRISSDLYGGDLELRGRVDSIGTGTGAIFSLLPPQNATGNWIKIVQRVPVRIALEQGFDRAHPLPFGASLQVRVDTHERDGPPLLPANSSAPVADIDVYDYQDEGVDEMIEQIIATASGNIAR